MSNHCRNAFGPSGVHHHPEEREMVGIILQKTNAAVEDAIAEVRFTFLPELQHLLTVPIRRLQRLIGSSPYSVYEQAAEAGNRPCSTAEVLSFIAKVAWDEHKVISTHVIPGIPAEYRNFSVAAIYKIVSTCHDTVNRIRPAVMVHSPRYPTQASQERFPTHEIATQSTAPHHDDDDDDDHLNPTRPRTRNKETEDRLYDGEGYGDDLTDKRQGNLEDSTDINNDFLDGYTPQYGNDEAGKMPSGKEAGTEREPFCLDHFERNLKTAGKKNHRMARRGTTGLMPFPTPEGTVYEKAKVVFIDETEDYGRVAQVVFNDKSRYRDVKYFYYQLDFLSAYFKKPE